MREELNPKPNPKPEGGYSFVMDSVPTEKAERVLSGRTEEAITALKKDDIAWFVSMTRHTDGKLDMKSSGMGMKDTPDDKPMVPMFREMLKGIDLFRAEMVKAIEKEERRQ